MLIQTWQFELLNIRIELLMEIISKHLQIYLHVSINILY